MLQESMSSRSGRAAHARTQAASDVVSNESVTDANLRSQHKVPVRECRTNEMPYILLTLQILRTRK